MAYTYECEEFTSKAQMLTECNTKGATGFKLAFIIPMGGKTYGLFEREC